ncbi:MAG: hypothetical protein ACI4RR_05070 [Eubacterium sp.]
MKNIIKRFIAVFSALIILASVDTTVMADLLTSQTTALNVNTSQSLAPYAEFNNKITDTSFIIPGLNSTISYDNEFSCFSSNTTMVPQAMCSVGHFTLITAYDSDEASKSVIYVLDYNKNLIKTLILPDSYHVGGIAYDINNKAILITKASKKCVAVISLDDFYKYLSFSGSFVKINYTVSESVSNNPIASASGVSYHNGYVFLSSFGTGNSSVVYCYTPVYDTVNQAYSLYFNYKFYVPNYTQGITVTNYRDETRLFVSVSYGRSESKSVYCSYLYTYYFDEATGAKTLDNILACPPMLQQTYCKGGKLYCLFESAACVYRSVNKDPIDLVIPIKLSRLCDEEQGSAVNIDVKNVANGKQINITTNIPDCTLYYSASLPYYSGKKLVSATAYNNSFTRSSSGTLYAVAVYDGRVVAADTAYFEVTKAPAPSKLRVTAKSSKAVNLAWTKASGASGYYVYRSTKKDSGYKLIATVKGNTGKYKDKTVKFKKNYYYKIKAYKNGYSNSDFTAYTSVKTK